MVIILNNKHYPINPRDIKYYVVDDKSVSIMYRSQGPMDMHSFATPEDAQRFAEMLDVEFRIYYSITK